MSRRIPPEMLELARRSTLLDRLIQQRIRRRRPGRRVLPDRQATGQVLPVDGGIFPR